MARKTTRRRFIQIVGVAAGLGLLPGALSRAAAPLPLHRWSGVALGADASLRLYHPDPEEAARLIDLSLAEVRRLEKIFSLYDQGSALCRLNRDGALADPPEELVELLGECERFARLSDGAFDVTVQPLWDLYATHFAAPDTDPAGPPTAAVATVLARVGHDGIEVAPDSIRFTRPDMAVTLNGIAQGYITDRVAALLRANGVGHTLVDMGETRALDGHPVGRPWSVGLKDPRHEDRVLRSIALDNQAISTSGGYGTVFDAAGLFNHIFDPGTGGCAHAYLSVSVVAPLATTADALSTAFSLMPRERARDALRAAGATAAYFVLADGSVALESLS